MYEYAAKIERWIDADTLLVHIDLGFSCFREERIRLARINAWEIKSESPYQRRWARSATFQARKKFPRGSSVIIQTKKNPVQDMYARYIAEVVCKGVNVSDVLVTLKGVEIFQAQSITNSQKNP